MAGQEHDLEDSISLTGTPPPPTMEGSGVLQSLGSMAHPLKPECYSSDMRKGKKKKSPLKPMVYCCWGLLFRFALPSGNRSPLSYTGFWYSEDTNVNERKTDPFQLRRTYNDFRWQSWFGICGRSMEGKAPSLQQVLRPKSPYFIYSYLYPLSFPLEPKNHKDRDSALFTTVSQDPEQHKPSM